MRTVEQVLERLQSRQAARASQGKGGESVCISAHEPEAMVQRLMRSKEDRDHWLKHLTQGGAE